MLDIACAKTAGLAAYFLSLARSGGLIAYDPQAPSIERLNPQGLRNYIVNSGVIWDSQTTTRGRREKSCIWNRVNRDNFREEQVCPYAPAPGTPQNQNHFERRQAAPTSEISWSPTPLACQTPYKATFDPDTSSAASSISSELTSTVATTFITSTAVENFFPTPVPHCTSVGPMNPGVTTAQCLLAEYCECASFGVPLRTATASGSIISDCSYTTAPTQAGCPWPTALPSPGPSPVPNVQECYSPDVWDPPVVNHTIEAYITGICDDTESGPMTPQSHPLVGHGGVPYMNTTVYMSISWVEGCTDVSSQDPFHPPAVNGTSFNCAELLYNGFWDYNCEHSLSFKIVCGYVRNVRLY